MHIETSRLLLRDYERSDLKAYYRLKSDEETMYYLQDLKLSNIEEARKSLDEVMRDRAKKERTFYFLHMELKTTHEQVGSIGYTVMDITPVGKLVHAGYFTYPKYWNHGYVTEAFDKLLEYAFLQDNVYRVTTGCLKENRGSEKVMQKCGLIKEAEHVDWEWHDGRMKTRLEYRILSDEWKCRNKEVK